tara:strand:+ start:452 stop:667 length:216 start_codon:yes stop_codon:yes gene_type:complete
MIIARKARKAETSKIRKIRFQSDLFLLTMYWCYVIVLTILTKNEEQMGILSLSSFFLSTNLSPVYPHLSES